MVLDPAGPETKDYFAGKDQEINGNLPDQTRHKMGAGTHSQ
jgi:hypothetical protein